MAGRCIFDAKGYYLDTREEVMHEVNAAVGEKAGFEKSRDKRGESGQKASGCVIRACECSVS